MLMGKGGVGKTTLAAAIAVELARRGYPVHLSTSDPAAHLTDTLDGSFDGLSVSRIDPQAETERYRQQVMAEQGKTSTNRGVPFLKKICVLLYGRNCRVSGFFTHHSGSG